MMSKRVQAFGGEHTRRKLDVVAKYLAAYVTVMKKQDFRLSYVDGFAGSGASTPKAESQKSDDPTLFPTADVMEGSPVRALGVEPPFDRYVFIEKREENVRSLSGLRAQFPTRQIDVVHGDANERLREFCDGIAANRLDRAVIFLDPFGLSVRWETIERISSIPDATLFVSFEPLIGRIDDIDLGKIHWAIVGGESGPRARPMNEEWVETRNSKDTNSAIPGAQYLTPHAHPRSPSPFVAPQREIFLHPPTCTK